MKVEISTFRLNSYDAVFSLWQQCEGVGLSGADSREGIQAYLERNPGMSFIATLSKNVIGAILAGHDGRRGYIHHLAVHPDQRRQGIARQLVERCLEVLAAVGIQKCHIFIFNSNVDGVEFWKNMDWVYRSDIGVMSKIIEPPPVLDRKNRAAGEA